MRKAQKKQAEDFVELLGQAHEEIRKAVEQQNIQTALTLLADCQEGAVSLGGLIETTEGQDAAVIPLLEEYCEVLFNIHTKLRESKVAFGFKESCGIEDMDEGRPYVKTADLREREIYQALSQSLIKISISIKKDIKIRREAVFLPYKASMWDSLESVWKAADEDPDCDAYVIPIPYYDRKPDGSFGEMHYEADQYPEYVPMTSYEAYDFEKRRPDMIFIHNPYDECNYVTSIMPFFYSKNLKQFTQQLIYIPYFILGEINAEDQQAMEGMDKFCLLPGVLNADKVIVQSEDMRQAYIKILTKASGEKTKQYWEKKILGLGSPKVDKIQSAGVEDLKIPEEWTKLIRKPDGERKKIIMYNTSVSALLEHSEKMLAKMRSVFRIFQENREEAVLLWRPHPLMKAAIESMRPRLWKEYQELVEQYRGENIGIYDDSPDMDRAVIVSDAYYGDWSSIVHLYRETGKPVMIQDVEIL